MDFKTFVEIPSESNIKYEVDEETGELVVDRFLHTAFVYPFNYGYIKDSVGEDGDPLDVIILSSYPVQAGVIMKCHALGLLEMEDEAGVDTKILAVPDKKIDPVYGNYNDISDVPEAILAKIKHFFDHMKELEPGKWVKTGDYKGRKISEDRIKKALKK